MISVVVCCKVIDLMLMRGGIYILFEVLFVSCKDDLKHFGFFCAECAVQHNPPCNTRTLVQMPLSSRPDLLDRVQTACAVTQNDDVVAISSCQTQFQ